MDKKIRTGVIGATGMIGQRLITLLAHHPYFEVTAIMASPRFAGKCYTEAVAGRWKMDVEIPEKFREMEVLDASHVVENASLVDLVFCAVKLDKEKTILLEEAYAKAEVIVISCNSANREKKDVPMIIPEINLEHLQVIPSQRKRLGCKKGFIVTKPNCSIQCYVPIITPLLRFEPTEIVVSTYQAISGAGKNFKEWPEMEGNIIPYIAQEEQKSEKEPLKIWGEVKENQILPNSSIQISAQCIRVPILDGHMASVFMRFKKKVSANEIIEELRQYHGDLLLQHLPSSPDTFVTVFTDENRPQIKLDKDLYQGMGISVGRIRNDSLFDIKFVGLAHNTLRGASGGAVLIAEALYQLGYFKEA